MRGCAFSASGSALASLVKAAVAKAPDTRELDDGFDGGGGVRLHPPHLEDSLAFLASCFQVRSQAMGAAPPRPRGVKWEALALQTLHDQ